MFTAIRHSQQGMIGGFMYAHSTGAGCRTLALLVVSMLVTAKSAEAQLSPTRTKTFLTIPAPQSVTATYDPLGVVIAWQPVAEAGQYLILRAPDVYTAGAQIGSVLAGTVRFRTGVSCRRRRTRWLPLRRTVGWVPVPWCRMLLRPRWRSTRPSSVE